MGVRVVAGKFKKKMRAWERACRKTQGREKSSECEKDAVIGKGGGCGRERGGAGPGWSSASARRARERLNAEGEVETRGNLNSRPFCVEL